MGESYPESLLEKAQSTWMANLSAPDQIKKVLEVIFTSEEFLTHTGTKVKRPYEFIVSAARATQAEFTPTMVLHWITMGMGYKPFMWPAPTGHPDKDSYWMGPGAMVTRWRVGGTILHWKEMGVFKFDLAGKTPVGYSYRKIVDYWSTKIIGSTLNEKYQKQVVKTFAGNDSPESVPALSPHQMENKLTMLAQFLIATPDFQLR